MVALKNVRFAYGDGGFALSVEALDLHRGERIACVGPSGSGKTTLAHLMAGILVPDQGTVMLDGQQLSGAADSTRRALRVSKVGMVFQQFALLAHLTGFENILLPYHVSSQLLLDDGAETRARELTAAMGIDHVLTRRPARLSQGERQRLAICRALVTQPGLVIADEPTGNLDPRATETTLELLTDQVAASGATLLVVTHDHSLLSRFHRVLQTTADGRVVPA
ncbi:MAG: putative ABC transport system ATP-binding protein [Pseudohongiellaceae bacterium]|jgi:putative ABC transport system ATP-binding protein